MFPIGTKVESYTHDRALKAKETADKVNAILSEPYLSWEMPDNAETIEISETISPGKSFLLQLDGSAEIVKLELKASAVNREKSLRGESKSPATLKRYVEIATYKVSL